MKKETRVTIIICIAFLFVAGVLYLRSGSWQKVQEQTLEGWTFRPAATPQESQILSGTDGEEGKPEEECTVYICGAVKHPGVYSFSADARVCDAVEAAGGFTGKAAPDTVNQARILADGEQITIPSVSDGGKKGNSTSVNTESQAEETLVNINKADREELMSLTGIGEAKAQMIIDYRSENGQFARKEDIMKISGIKEGIYNQIKDSITV